MVHEWEDAEVPSDRTTVTELGTGLGMLGLGSIEEAVRSRAPAMHSVSPEMWEHLEQAGGGGGDNYHAAWAKVDPTPDKNPHDIVRDTTYHLTSGSTTSTL